MSPRTNSPPPSSYENYDYTTNDLGNDTINNVNIALINNRNVRNNNNNDTQTNNVNNSGIFSALLLRPFNIPRRVFSSITIQFFSLIMIYSFCIMVLWIIFCASYLLTFYDDARRMFHTSRVWARVKNGVRERIAMMGDDWEDFFQKYFDRDGVDGNKNGHLGGGLNNNNNNNNNDNNGGNNNSDNNNTTDWEDWLKGTMFKFMTTVAGQDVADKFKQSTSAFQSQFGNSKKTNTTNKNATSNGDRNSNNNNNNNR